MAIKVKLKDDLTGYHPKLIKGAVGYTTDRRTVNDCYVYVQFTTFYTPQNILWKSLEIIDEEYLEERRKEKEIKFAAIKEIGRAELRWNPSGSFNCLLLKYPESLNGRGLSTSANGIFSSAIKLYDELREAGIEIHDIGVAREDYARKFGGEFYDKFMKRKKRTMGCHRHDR